MLKHFDHVTIAVRDIAAARTFFETLGFEKDKDVVIQGKQMEDYMSVDGIQAEHMTLHLKGATPRMEVQLLRYIHPELAADPSIHNLARLGFNHICFAVDDLEAEVARIQQAGIELRSPVMDFHRRKLVFLSGPEDVTVELAQWVAP